MTSTAPAGVASIFPCAPNQRQFIRLDRRGAGKAALNFAFRYQIDGPLRAEVLQQALDRLVARHEILRTCFAGAGDAAEQHVMTTVAAPIASIDLSHLSSEAAHVEALELGRRDAEKPFDLACAPLFRLTMLRLGATRHILLFTFHAAVIDGWSIGILVSELGRLVASIDSGQSPELPPVEIPYGDYARWQQAMRDGGGFDEGLRFWASELKGMREFRLPPSRTVPPTRRYPSLTRGIILDRAETDKAAAFAQNHGATFYHLALAALSRLLYARTGSAEIVLGTQVSGRTEQEAESIVGPVLNPLVLRLPVGAAPTGASFLDCARRVSMDALSHQQVPFECVVEAIAPSQKNSRNPLYSINFALQAAFIHEDATAALDNGQFRLHSLPSASHSALWDLNFGLVERPDGWRMSCEADGDLHSEGAVDDLLAAWSSALREIVERPEQTVAPPVQAVGQSRAASVAAERARPEPAHATEVHALPLAARKTAPRAPRLAISRPDFIDDRITVYQPQASGLPVMALNVTSLFYPLATYDPERAFYDIQLAGDVAPPTFEPRAIGDLAADAVRLILKARPKGPYVLLAYCVSGAIALEAARQLREQGASVPLVVLIDTWRPGFRESLSRFEKRQRRFAFLAFRYALDLERVKAGRMSRWQALKRLRITAPLRRLLWLKPLGTDQEGYESHPNDWYIEQIHHAYAYHRPRAYDGRVLLIAAEKICKGRLFPDDMGWTNVITGGFERREVPGEHEDVLKEPAVSALGAELQAALTKLDTDVRGRVPVGSP